MSHDGGFCSCGQMHYSKAMLDECIFQNHKPIEKWGLLSWEKEKRDKALLSIRPKLIADPKISGMNRAERRKYLRNGRKP